MLIEDICLVKRVTITNKSHKAYPVKKKSASLVKLTLGVVQMHKQQQQPMYPPQFPGRFPVGQGQPHHPLQTGMHPQAFGGPGFRQMPFPQPPRPFLHSFRTQEGTLDYNKIFSVIDQSVKVAQQISPLFSAFKKK
jgi:hypothetical protein